MVKYRLLEIWDTGSCCSIYVFHCYFRQMKEYYKSFCGLDIEKVYRSFPESRLGDMLRHIQHRKKEHDSYIVNLSDVVMLDNNDFMTWNFVDDDREYAAIFK